MDEQEIQFIAQARADINATHPTTDAYGGSLYDVHLRGVRGEVCFADRYRLGYERIRDVKRGSDGGFDFEVHFDRTPVTIDVKTRDTSGDDLLMPAYKFEPGKRCAHIIVLARNVGKRVTLIGFEHPLFVRIMRPVSLNVAGNTVVTHIRPWEEMRPMWQLDRLMRGCDELRKRA